MLIVSVAFLIGILRCRIWAYWKWAIVMAAWAFVWPMLFHGGGTLQHPEYDGLITGAVRTATQDGPEVALVGLASVVVFWAGIAFFIWRMYRAYRTALDAGLDTGAADPGRKPLEITALCLVTAGFVYLYYLDFQDRLAAFDTAGETPQAGSQTGGQGQGSVTQDPIARELQKIAAELTATAPRQIDQVTTLERVTTTGRMLVYHYSLARRIGPDDELMAFVRKNNKPTFCGDPEMRDLIVNHGVVYRYSYLFPGSDTPLTVDIDEESCGDG